MTYKQPDDKQRVGLLVTMSLYFCTMLAIGIVAWREQKKRRAEAARRSGAGGATAEDSMGSHFVAGNSLGMFVTVCTLFASLFSGYTVVGVPNEAFRTGFVALRWFPALLFLCVGLMGTAPRMRKASLVRNHQSPCDFITDRFGSQLLRYTVFLLMLVPTLIYLSAQLVALSDKFNDLFGIDHGNHTAVILIATFILLLEFLGGLTVVAYTDSIQGVLMVVGFVLLSSTLAHTYGSWSSDTFDPRTYPSPSFFQVPSADTQLSMWTFAFQCLSFLTLPHFIQRTYAADSFKSLKTGFVVITAAPWLTMIVGVYVGTVGVHILRDEANVDSPFTEIITALMEKNDFGYIAGLLVLTSSIAAIMSTADSLLIAASHLCTSEIFFHISDVAKPSGVDVAAKLFSTLTMVIALAVAVTDDGTLSNLFAIQNGMSLQACPAFITGLFFSDTAAPHPWCLVASALSGLVTTVTVYSSSPGAWGLLVNVGLLVVLEGALRVRGKSAGGQTRPALPSWDQAPTARFGELPLTGEVLASIMDGVYEPFLQGWFLPLVFALSFFVLPTTFTAAGLPSLGTQAADGSYPDFSPATVGGLPDWGFKLLMVALLFTIVLLYAVSRIPADLDDLGVNRARKAARAEKSVAPTYRTTGDAE